MTDEKLRSAVSAGIITAAQAEQLRLLWQDAPVEELGSVDAKGAGVSKFLYYLGTLIVIGAMGWLMNTAWESFRGIGLFLIAAGYATTFIFVAKYWRERSPVLGGLFVVMAVCMTPLAVFGLQSEMGVWPFDEPGRYRGF